MTANADKTDVVISISNLNVTRGKREVLANFNLEINKGSVTGLLGPSGCGKTTLMRSIVGLQIIKSGDVQVLGRKAGSLEVRERLGYMSQSPAVYSDISVLANLKYFASISNTSSTRVNEVLDLIELSSHKDSLTGNLSNGQKARVSLGIALLPDPEVLVLDEPTVGLDPLLRERLWSVFGNLSSEGCTLLVSSHVMAEAEHCNSLVLMRDGEVIYHGSNEELLHKTEKNNTESAFITIVSEGVS